MNAQTRNLSMIALASIALVIALYLLTVHMRLATAVCLGLGDCEVVNTSIYSELFGIPIALLGSLSYISLIVLGLAVWKDFYAEYARLARFFIASIGVAFYIYLTYIEVAVLHEICPWCVMTSIAMLCILILSIWDLRAGEMELAES